MKTHVTASGAWDGEQVRLEDAMTFHAQLRRMGLGAGESVVVTRRTSGGRQAASSAEMVYGYIVKQCVEKTGYTVPELDAMFRALFMAGDVETLSLMSLRTDARLQLALRAVRRGNNRRRDRRPGSSQAEGRVNDKGRAARTARP